MAENEEELDIEHHKPLHANNQGTWSSIKGWLSEEATSSLLSVLPKDHQINQFRFAIASPNCPHSIASFPSIFGQGLYFRFLFSLVIFRCC